MYIDIIWKTLLPTLIGLFVIAAIVINSSAHGSSIAHSNTESRAVTRSAPASSVCNILYPVPCAYVQPW
jgi:hypothetical protein